MHKNGHTSLQLLVQRVTPHRNIRWGCAGIYPTAILRCTLLLHLTNLFFPVFSCVLSGSHAASWCVGELLYSYSLFLATEIDSFRIEVQVQYCRRSYSHDVGVVCYGWIFSLCMSFYRDSIRICQLGIHCQLVDHFQFARESLLLIVRLWAGCRHIVSTWGKRLCLPPTLLVKQQPLILWRGSNHLRYAGRYLFPLGAATSVSFSFVNPFFHCWSVRILC